MDKNKNETEKFAFADRIFMHYNGSCDDLELFTIKSTKPRAVWAQNYSLNGIDVPSQYLAENVKDTVDTVAILQLMPSILVLTKQQKQAIKYAIECIKKVKESETTMNQITSIIHNYKSQKH